MSIFAEWDYPEYRSCRCHPNDEDLSLGTPLRAVLARVVEADTDDMPCLPQSATFAPLRDFPPSRKGLVCDLVRQLADGAPSLGPVNTTSGGGDGSQFSSVRGARSEL